MSTIVHSFEAETVNSNSNSRKMKMQNHKFSSALKKFLFIFIALIIVVGILGYLMIVVPGKAILTSVKKLQTSGTQVTAMLKQQDMGAVKAQMTLIKSNLDEVKSNFQKLQWTASMPVLKNYYADGTHSLDAANEVLAAGNLAIDGIAPYADIIGLKGLNAPGDSGKTAQERINFIVNTLKELEPQLENIGQHLEKAKEDIALIDTTRYPETFQGQPLRSQMDKGKVLLDEAAVLTNDARPLLVEAPYMLGMDAPRKYLVLFQNDAELRPTGGFITAYALVQVNKGKVSLQLSDDVYNLDAKFTKKITAPAPILKYLPKVPYWNLRDMNLSPDFKVSMDTFYPNYLTTGSPQVDGIITMDTQVLVDMVGVIEQVLGKPLGVPGFGNFSAKADPACNCPQVFYALELYADPEGPVIWDSVSGRIIAQPANYGARKSFIGPMTKSIMDNILGMPKSKMPDLFNTALTLIAQKHIQFYFTDPKAQNAVETFNMAGRVRDWTGDYLMVVDTNFAGAKTNTWVTYDAGLKVDAGNSGTTNTLTLVYQNPQNYFTDAKTGLKLNGVFRDWLRVYLPQGSKLVDASGFETGQAVGDDLNKTVVEGFFTLTPKNNHTIVLKYTTPANTSPYHLLIEKQGGTKSFSYNVTVNNQKQPEIILDSDKEVTVSY
jgi:hypothetical protein